MEDRVASKIDALDASPETKLRMKVLLLWMGEHIHADQACRMLGLTEPELWELHDRAVAAVVQGVEADLRAEQAEGGLGHE